MKQYLLPSIIGVIALLLLLLVVMGPGVAPLSQTPPPTESTAEPAQAVAVGATASLTAPVSPNLPQAQAPAAGPQENATETQEAILDQISDAAFSFSPDALPYLAEKLNSSDPAIREAALEGIKVLAEPGGIEVLRKASRRARNEHERRQLLEAADWLALPDWQIPGN